MVNVLKRILNEKLYEKEELIIKLQEKIMSKSSLNKEIKKYAKEKVRRLFVEMYNKSIFHNLKIEKKYKKEITKEAKEFLYKIFPKTKFVYREEDIITEEFEKYKTYVKKKLDTAYLKFSAIEDKIYQKDFEKTEEELIVKLNKEALKYRRQTAKLRNKSL